MTWRRAAVPAYALVLALAVTAPLLGPGYLLLRDAVSTPRSHLTDAALGLSQAAPRALPQDFAVALTSTVVDGGLVVKGLTMLGLSWIGMRATPPSAQTPLTKMMGYMMPVMMTVLFWNFASGLNLYYGVQNLVALPQQWLLTRERAKAAR